LLIKERLVLFKCYWLFLVGHKKNDKKEQQDVEKDKN
jgi:hypothetical protein